MVEPNRYQSHALLGSLEIIFDYYLQRRRVMLKLKKKQLIRDLLHKEGELETEVYSSLVHYLRNSKTPTEIRSTLKYVNSILKK